MASGQLVAADVDLGDTVVFTGSANGALGAFAIDAAGAWTYTLNTAAAQSLAAGQTTTEVFTTTATDSFGATVTQDVTLTITGTNDAPVLTNYVGAGYVGGASGQLTATDVDAGDVAVWSATGGLYGSFAVDANGAFVYTLDMNDPDYQLLAAGQTALEDVIVTVSDGHGGQSQYALPFEVTGVGPAPTVTGATTGAVKEDGTLAASGQLTASTAALFSGNAVGSYGSFGITDSGAWSYALNNAAVQGLAAGQVVTETFTTTATDGLGRLVTTPVTVTITGTNDAPVVSGNRHGAVMENGPATVSGQLVAADVDAGAVVTWSLSAGAPVPANPLLYLVSGTNGQLSAFNPVTHTTTALGGAPGFGTNAAGYDEATDTIWALRTNANVLVQYSTTGAVLGQYALPPGIVGAGSIAASFGPDGLMHVLNGNQMQAIDVHSQTLVSTQTITGAPSSLMDIAYNPITNSYLGISNGRLYSINATSGAATSVASPTVTDANALACDGSGHLYALLNGSAVYQINPLSGAATAVSAPLGLGAGDAAMSIDGAVAAVPGNGTYGALAIDPATGQWAYTLDNTRPATQSLAVGQTATDTITVIATDDKGAAVPVQVVITITGTNDAPVLTGAQPALAGNLTEGVAQVITGQVTANDPDLGDVLTFTTNGNGTYGSLAMNPTTGVWSYAAAHNSAAVNALGAGQVVSDSFAVTVSDGHGGSVLRNLVFRITGTNDAPIVTGTTTGAVSGTQTNASGALSISDAEGNATTITIPQGPTYGSFAIDANGAWTYALNTGSAAYLGLALGSVVTDTATVQVSDGHGGVVNRSVSIAVTGPTAPPAPYAIHPFSPMPGQNNVLQATASGYIVNGAAVTAAQPISDIFASAPSHSLMDSTTFAGNFSGAAWNNPVLHYIGGNAGDSLTLFNAKGLGLDVAMGGGNDTTYLSLGQFADVVNLNGGAGGDLLYLVSNGQVAVQNAVIDFSQFQAGQISINGVATQVSGYETLFYSGSKNTIIGTDLADSFADMGAGTYHMGAGNDAISVYNTNFQATPSTYDMGDGDDQVIFQYGMQISSGTAVDGGAGINSVTFNGVSVMHTAGAGAVTLGGATVSLANIERVTINGDAGDSDIQGTGFNDLINGGAGNDIMLDGLAGNDTLIGGLGNDRVMLGGDGSDRFIFRAGDGSDTVVAMDTATGASHDVIEFSGLVDAAGVAVNSFASLMTHMTVGAGTALFDFGGGNRVVLEAVDVATLTADDFLFS